MNRAWIARGPELSRWQGVEIRISAIQSGIQDVARVSVCTLVNGEPIAEDPLHVEFLADAELDRILALSRKQGWQIQDDPRVCQTPPPPQDPQEYQRQYQKIYRESHKEIRKERRKLAMSA